MRQEINFNGNTFAITKEMFRNYTGYTRPLSYQEWLHVNQEDKAAVLFVQFYDQITLAWYKVNTVNHEAEEAIETIMQYLQKNVAVIEKDEKRFNPKYIYRVAHNCLYCICYDRKRDKERREKEISNIQYRGVHSDDEAEFNLFDTIVVDEDTVYIETLKKRLWEVIDLLIEKDPSIADIIDSMMNGGKKSTGYKKDGSAKNCKDINKRFALADKHEHIIETIRVELDRVIDREEF